jgi:hypothetical protein
MTRRLVKIEDLSHLTAKSLTYGSMAGTNTVSQPVAFQPPGSLSESVVNTDIRPELPPIPPLAARFTAGPGDRGGTLHGDGEDPGGSYAWDDVATGASGDDDGRWSRAVTPVTDPGH